MAGEGFDFTCGGGTLGGAIDFTGGGGTLFGTTGAKFDDELITGAGCNTIDELDLECTCMPEAGSLEERGET